MGRTAIDRILPAELYVVINLRPSRSVDLSANVVENEHIADDAIARNIGGEHRDQEASNRTTRNVGRESGATVSTSAAGIGTR